MQGRNKGGALQGVQLSQLHQQSSVAFICSVGVLIARLVYLKGVHLSPLGFAACQSKKCTNRVAWLSFAWLVYLLLGWCTSCLVGALETSAPPEVTSAQIHRLRPLPDRIPFAIRSDSVRCPIGFRSPPDRIPSAAQSDCVRRPIGFRSPSNDLSLKIVAEVSGLRSTKSDTKKYS